jgi:acyl-CoA dehydrogenase
MDFSHSDKAREMISRVKSFIQQHVAPIEKDILTDAQQGNPDWKSWTLDPRLEAIKQQAKAEGLWNLFLPDPAHGGLCNRDYAPVAEQMGFAPFVPELFNCNAPDTGNMEVIWKYGTAEQKEQWMKPLLAGEIRSAFCMTEPEVASSDATNMRATITDDGDHVIVNGRKWWSSGIGHPNCRIAIVMGLTDPTAHKYLQHSMVLVPLDTPGVKIERMMPVFGAYDAPYGHGEVLFNHVRIPKSNLIAGLGKGFEIAQGRLGPGRIHHCMRAIGAAERALQLMIERASAREAFGKPLLNLGGNRDIIANARMDIDMARLLVMKTAWLLDTKGVMAALSEVSQIKVVAPNIACRIIDQAMQMHGGMGMSNDTVLSSLYGYARILRIADGPDEVHRGVVAKVELKKYGTPK